MTPGERRGLSKKAYEPLGDEEYDPYIPASESPLEFTAKSIFAGILFNCLGINNEAQQSRNYQPRIHTDEDGAALDRN